MESTKYFFLQCHHYTNIHKTLLNTVEMIDESILNVNDDDLIEILLFGNCKFCLERNLSIIKASINYIVSSLGGSIGYTFFLCYLHFYNFSFNWDSLHARLHSHYKAWSYKKKKHKNIRVHRESTQKEPTFKRCLLTLDLKPLRS